MADRFAEVFRDLDFYFNHSAAAFGYRSNFSSFISAIQGVSSSNVDPDSMTDGILASVRKARKVERVLYSLPSDTRTALTICYDNSYRFPVTLTAIYGRKAGCVLFTRRCESKEELLALCRKTLRKSLTEEERIKAFEIRRDARALWNAINEAYLSAKKSAV